jgi:hypothetical protein
MDDMTGPVGSARKAARSAARRLAPGIFTRLDLLRHVEDHVVPIGRPDVGGNEYLASRLRPIAGIDLREEAQVDRIEGWTRYAEQFARIRDDEQINTWYCGGDRLHNGYYATPEAEAYVAMIGDERPATIVEVGAGYSTLIARSTIDQLGLDCTLVVVDPDPRTDVTLAADVVVQEPVENTELDELLGSGTAFLFIDSSHIVRIGGDVPFLYGEVIPRLAAGTFVHVHDIYCPYDYPDYVLRELWTEQYMLEALLAHSPRYRIEVATQFLSHRHADVMQRVISPAVGNDPRHYGSSIWLRVCR